VTTESVVLDASALVDLLHQPAPVLRARVDGRTLHAPAHLDAEVLSALGRLHRAGLVTADAVASGLAAVVAAPITRHDVASLLEGAWGRREAFRLADALYIELADRLAARLVTTDQRLARATPIVDVIVP
jgi:predicted nucleic acid-binding protein